MSVERADDERDERRWAGMDPTDEPRPSRRCTRRWSVPGNPRGRWRQCIGTMEDGRCRLCGQRSPADADTVTERLRHL